MEMALTDDEIRGRLAAVELAVSELLAMHFGLGTLEARVAELSPPRHGGNVVALPVDPEFKPERAALLVLFRCATARRQRMEEDARALAICADNAPEACVDAPSA